MGQELPPGDVRRIVPHRGAMLLIERVVEVGALETGEQFAVAEMRVDAGSPWVRDGALIRPALIEFAAQTAAALAGAGSAGSAGTDPGSAGSGGVSESAFAPRSGFLGGIDNLSYADTNAVVGDLLRARVTVGFRMGALVRCSFVVTRRVAPTADVLAEGTLSLALGPPVQP